MCITWTYPEPLKFLACNVLCACADIDECEVSSPCHDQASCENTNGSFNCLCDIGLTGDGVINCTGKRDILALRNARDHLFCVQILMNVLSLMGIAVNSATTLMAVSSATVFLDTLPTELIALVSLF